MQISRNSFYIRTFPKFSLLASILHTYTWISLPEDKEVNARLSGGVKMRICKKMLEVLPNTLQRQQPVKELNTEVKKIANDMELTIGINGIGKKSHFLKWEHFPIEPVPGYGYSIMIV